MFIATISNLMILTALASPAGTRPTAGIGPAGRTAMPEVVYTRQTMFAIPFRLDTRVTDPSQEPAEVQLYVSADRGNSWQLYDRAAPSRDKFLFRVEMDGEFWFIVRTVDRSGRARSEDSSTPGLRVAVDTRPPQLSLQANRGQAGEVTAKWQVDETSLKAGSLNIQYRVDGGPWQTVAINSTAAAASPTARNGEVTWYPRQGNGLIEVRAEIADAAGNPAVNSARIEPAAAAIRSNYPIAHTNVQPAAEGNIPNSTKWPAEKTDSTPLAGDTLGDRYTTDRYAKADTAPLGAQDSNRPVDRLQKNRYEVDRRPADRYAEKRVNPRPSNDAVAGPWRASPERNDSVAAVVSPPLRNEYTPSAENTTANQTFRMPPGERPRMVSSKVFELQYDVESVGPTGVTRVELWGTRDGGQTWQVIAVDDDNRSPLQAMVKQDGIYGFRIVVRSGVGQAMATPQSGDLPDAWLGVDTTKPTAQIITAQQQSGQDAENLVITWSATDGLLSSRPITLLFAESPAGPWTNIAAGLENSGRYVWRLGARVPNQVHLRMEVRDEAGNLEQVDLPHSILLRRPQPTVRIGNVRPLGTASRSQPNRYSP
jgi:hypothetical protein